MTQQARGSGPDLIGDFQRWLVRSGARSVSREVGGHLRSVLGRNEPSGDVWESATSDAPDEAPECAWCPVCRAARVLRESGPGVTSQVAAASDARAGLVHDALSVVASALAGGGGAGGPRSGAAGPRRGAREGGGAGWDRPGSRWDKASSGTAAKTAGPAAAWDQAAAGITWVEAEPASVWEQAGPGPRPEPDAADAAGPAEAADAAGPADEPGPTGSPGEPPHEPDHRD